MTDQGLDTRGSGALTTVAELAGTSRATVNKVLREEEKRGVVSLRRGSAVVLDREALARRAR